MKKLVAVLVLALAMSTGAAAAASAYTASNPTYSTNDYNRGHGGPHVDQALVARHLVVLRFVNPNPYAACFEYRTDGNTGQRLSENGGQNYNPAIADGLYPYLCLSAGSRLKVFLVGSYVEVRSVFGAERSWDFTWTRFNSR